VWCGNKQRADQTNSFFLHTHTQVYTIIIILLLYSLKFFFPQLSISDEVRGVYRCEHRLHAVSVYNTMVTTHSGRTRKSPGLLCSSVYIQSIYIYKKMNKNAVRKRNKQNIIYKRIYTINYYLYYIMYIMCCSEFRSMAIVTWWLL